jgi:hypothetical protein
MEPMVNTSLSDALALTHTRYPGWGQYQVGSLTGAVASERVTEARKGWLRLNGNQPQSVKAEASLTARPDKSSRDESRA